MPTSFLCGTRWCWTPSATTRAANFLKRPSPSPHPSPASSKRRSPCWTSCSSARRRIVSLRDAASHMAIRCSKFWLPCGRAARSHSKHWKPLCWTTHPLSAVVSVCFWNGMPRGAILSRNSSRSVCRSWWWSWPSQRPIRRLIRGRWPTSRKIFTRSSWGKLKKASPAYENPANACGRSAPVLGVADGIFYRRGRDGNCAGRFALCETALGIDQRRFRAHLDILLARSACLRRLCLRLQQWSGKCSRHSFQWRHQLAGQSRQRKRQDRGAGDSLAPAGLFFLCRRAGIQQLRGDTDRVHPFASAAALEKTEKNRATHARFARDQRRLSVFYHLPLCGQHLGAAARERPFFRLLVRPGDVGIVAVPFAQVQFCRLDDSHDAGDGAGLQRPARLAPTPTRHNPIQSSMAR